MTRATRLRWVFGVVAVLVVLLGAARPVAAAGGDVPGLPSSAVSSPFPAASPSPSASPTPQPTASPTASPSVGGQSGACSVPGLSQLCAVGGAILGAPGAVVGGVTSSIFHAFVQWVADGAVSMLGLVGQKMQTAGSPQLNTNWFNLHYQMMAQVGASFMALFLILAIFQGLLRGDAVEILKAALVRVPLALLFTAAAATLTALGIAVTDSASTYVASTMQQDLATFIANVSSSLSAQDPVTALFLVFLGALVIALGGLLVFVELVAREAGIYICLLFVPLVTAAGVWPAAAKWQRRIASFLVALVLSKFVIIAIVSLGAGALAADNQNGGFTAMLAGAVIVLLAAMSPFLLLAMMPVQGAGHLAMSAGRSMGRGVLGRGGDFARQTVARGGGQSAGGLRLAGAGAAGAGGAAAAAAGPIGAATAAGKAAKSVVTAPAKQLTRAAGAATASQQSSSSGSPPQVGGGGGTSPPPRPSPPPQVPPPKSEGPTNV